MREKIYNVLNKVYGVILFISFVAGILPIIPFIIALIIGGPQGEAISVFLYKQYYPRVAASAAISVFVGWIASYFLKNDSKKKKTVAEKSESSDADKNCKS